MVSRCLPTTSETAEKGDQMVDQNLDPKKWPSGAVMFNRMLATYLDAADGAKTPIETWQRAEWDRLEQDLRNVFKDEFGPTFLYKDFPVLLGPGKMTKGDQETRRKCRAHLKKAKVEMLGCTNALRKRITNAQPHVREGLYRMIADWRSVWRDPNIPQEKKTLVLALSDQHVLKTVPSDQMSMQLDAAVRAGPKAFKKSEGFDWLVAQGVAREGKPDQANWALQLMPAGERGAEKRLFNYTPDAQEKILGKMEAFRDRLGHRHGDILTYLENEWAEGPSNSPLVQVTLDSILDVLGYTKSSNAAGGSGYRKRDRDEVRRQVEDLENQHLTVHQVVKNANQKLGVYSSRVLVIMERDGGQIDLDGQQEWSRISITFGPAWAYRLRGPGIKQVMHLQRKALAYDYKTEVYEKAIAIALAFFWRVNITKRTTARYRMLDIFVTYIQENPENLTRRRAERVEEALDRLEKDGLIAAWRYEDGIQLRATEGHMPHRWAESWLERFVEIEAPRDLITLYDDRNRGKQAAAPTVAYQQQESLGERLKTFRLNNNITALRASELIGIDNGTLSKIESGKMQPGEKVSGRISAWLADMKNHPAKRAAMHETKRIE